jgi:hypothetical protein
LTIVIVPTTRRPDGGNCPNHLDLTSPPGGFPGSSAGPEGFAMALEEATQVADCAVERRKFGDWSRLLQQNLHHHAKSRRQGQDSEAWVNAASLSSHPVLPIMPVVATDTPEW